MILLIVIVLLIIIYLYKFYKDNYFYWRNQGVYGPFPIPLISDYYRYFFRTMHDADLDCLKKYGKRFHSFASLSYPEVTIAEPELIRQVLIQDFKQYNGRDDGAVFAEYFDKILFIRDETNGWRNLRKTISPLFTTGKLKTLYSNLNKPMKNLIDGLDGQLKHRESFENFNPLVNFKRFTFDIILNLFFSAEFNSFKIESDDFIEKFLNAKPSSTLLNVFTLYTPVTLINLIAKFYKIIPMDQNTYKYLVQLSLNCIKERRKNKNSNYNDLIQLLIQTDLPDSEIVGQCLGLFLGGFESVSQTCTYALYELALQPNLQDRLYKEIKEKFPDDNLEIDYEKITDSPYLEAVIKETLRMHLVISKLFRKALVDCELGDIKLKKGHFISIPVYAMHHSEEFYRDPFKFDPERFVNGEPEPFTYLPFGDGPRTCIAMRLAQLEVRYFLINFIKRYEVYRTNYTKVPLKYYKFNFLFNCEDILIGIKSRKKED